MLTVHHIRGIITIRIRGNWGMYGLSFFFKFIYLDGSIREISFVFNFKMKSGYTIKSNNYGNNLKSNVKGTSGTPVESTSTTYIAYKQNQGTGNLMNISETRKLSFSSTNMPGAQVFFIVCVNGI
jgi:hypothetical protein